MSYAIRLSSFKTESTHLPEGNRDVRLDYLTNFSTGSPFTIEQEKVFLSAKMWININWWSLRLGLVLCSALSAAPAWINNNQKNGNTILITASVALGIISYFCTGTFPDQAAYSSTQTIDEVTRTRKMYEEIAYHLLEIYRNDKTKAKLLAEQINVPNIQSAMIRFIHPRTAKEICSVLHHAGYAVLHDRPHEDAPPLVESKFQIIQLQEQLQTRLSPA
jgi:hypothetical protein